MVTTSDGKHFSLGLEFELLTSTSYSDFMKYITDVQDLFRRLLTFPIVTVAAVNGVLTVVCWLTCANCCASLCRGGSRKLRGRVRGQGDFRTHMCKCRTTAPGLIPRLHPQNWRVW